MPYRRISEIDELLAVNATHIDSIEAEASQVLKANGFPLGLDDDLDAARDKLPDGPQEALTRYADGRDKLIAERNALRAERLTRVQIEAAMAAGGPQVEGPNDHLPNFTKGRPMNALTTGRGDYQAAALRALEAARLAPSAGDRLDAVIRAEPTSAHARYLAAVADPAYAEAFAAIMADSRAASIELGPDERAATREARAAATGLRLALGEDPGGLSTGWPLPLQVDPTLIMTGDGSSNPLRRLATVRTIASKTLTIVTAAQVAAGYGAEGTDVAEITPAPTPVKLQAERGGAFVRLTFEQLGDFAGSTGEIARLFGDARDNLEAQKFIIGTGSDEPLGIVAGLTPFDGAPATVADLIACQGDLGARYQNGASWLANLAVLNGIGQYVAEADASNAKIIDANGNLLRKRVNEASFMPAGDLIYGDIRAGFCIVDRLGMSVEPTGPTFNISTGLPDGNRGFLAIWRSGSAVVDADALRLLAGA
ncbi:MAG: phage major capsid protein [Candidatus Limnocylindrales bacterium]